MFGDVFPVAMSPATYRVALACGSVIVWLVAGRLFHSFPWLVAGTVRLAITIPAATFFPLFSLNWIVYFLGYAFGVAQILE